MHKALILNELVLFIFVLEIVTVEKRVILLIVCIFIVEMLQFQIHVHTIQCRVQLNMCKISEFHSFFNVGYMSLCFR